MLEALLIVAPGLLGAILCAYGYWAQANMIWVFGNIVLIVHNYKQGDMSQTFLFSVYELISLFGIARWYYMRKDKQKKRDKRLRYKEPT
jgi:nicotinamide riboside transporter PnuC